MKLARLIADIQPEYTREFKILFSARFDAKHDKATMEYVGKKFGVIQHTSSRREIGWPAGPNGMAHDLFMEAQARLRRGEWDDVDALWLLEADALPLTADWLQRIKREWRDSGKLIMGAWQREWSPVGHINGNMLFSPTLADRVRGLEGCAPHIPWDTHHAVKFSRHWHKSGQMVNFYKRTNVTENEIYPPGEPWCFVHGIKDDSAELIVRRRILNTPVAAETSSA